MSDDLQPRVLLLGTGYLPYASLGEMHFFHELVPHLTLHKASVAVASINDLPTLRQYQANPFGENIPVYNFARPLHGRDHERFTRMYGDLPSYTHKHGVVREIAEKGLSIAAHIGRIEQIIDRHQISVLHLMNKFVPAILLLRHRRPGLAITSSFHYHAHTGILYDMQLRLGFSRLDAAVSFDQFSARKLVSLNLPPSVRMEVIRRGIPLTPQTLHPRTREKIRARYGFRDDSRLVLWANDNPALVEQDFLRTVNVARELVSRRDDIEFGFVFREGMFRSCFYREQQTSVKIINDMENFDNLAETADLFLSPVGMLEGPIHPSRLWLRAMARGTPVMTTMIGMQQDELIVRNDNGFVAPTYSAIPDEIERVLAGYDLRETGRRARDMVRNHYDIEQSAGLFVDLWRTIVAGGRSRPVTSRRAPASPAI